MKKFVSLVVVIFFGQLTFGQDNEISISAKCRDKITKFSIHFADASMPFFGDIPVSIGKVEVSPKAVSLGESGFADGSGTYDLTIGDKDGKETSKVAFSFRYMTEPRCTITKIKLSDAM